MTGPLASLRILDFTALVPGPFATMLLADLGTDVVRVESLTRPDLVRHQPPLRDGLGGWYATLNRSKRSLGLDLKQAGAAAVVRRLVARYDIVVEQNRPGVMERLGLGYEQLRAANPRLIYCALTGYGQDGPYRDRAGHDLNYVALSGIAAHSGRADGSPPPLGVPLADLAAANAAVIAILAAVVHRRQTGEGQFLDVSMFDTALAWNALAIADTLAGAPPAPESGLLNGGSAYDTYATADGRYLSVGALEPKFWRAFCAVIERPDLANAPPVLAQRAPQAIKEAVAAAIAARPLADWVTRFAAVDACVEPVLAPDEAVEHPQAVARGALVLVPNPAGEPQPQVAHPVRFSATPPVYRHVGPPLGAHTRAVLGEAGFGEAELRELQEQGVIYQAGEEDAG